MYAHFSHKLAIQCIRGLSVLLALAMYRDAEINVKQFSDEKPLEGLRTYASMAFDRIYQRVIDLSKQCIRKCNGRHFRS